jgi:hypothetical protein
MRPPMDERTRAAMVGRPRTRNRRKLDGQCRICEAASPFSTSEQLARSGRMPAPGRSTSRSVRGVMTHGSTHLRVLDDDFVLHIVAGARELLHDPQLVGVKEAAAREPGCGLAKMRVNRSGSGRGIPRTFPQPCEVFRGGRPRSSRGPNERSILPWSAS